MDRTEPTDLKHQSVGELVQQGETYRIAGQSAQAIEYFDAALSKQPNDAWALAHRGAALALQGRYIEAIANLTKAIDISKEPYIWAHVQRGETYRLRATKGVSDEHQEPFQSNIKYLELAIDDFSVALRARPNYPYALAHRAACYRFMGRSGLETARRDLLKAVDIDATYAWGWAFLSVVNHLLGKGEEAFDNLLKAVQLDNTIMGDSSTVLGMYANGKKEYKQAAQYFQISLNRNPNLTIARYGLAIAMFHLKGREGAKAFIDSALIAVREDLALASYQLAGLEKLMGREQDSLKHLADAIEQLSHVRQWVHLDTGAWGENLARTNLIQAVRDGVQPGTLGLENEPGANGKAHKDKARANGKADAEAMSAEDQAFFDLISPTIHVQE